MPELPELEIVQDVLERRLVGRRIMDVSLSPKGGPIVVRDLTGQGFRQGLTGRTIESVQRRGKFLLFGLGTETGPKPAGSRGEPALTLAVNPKLTGRLQLSSPAGKKAGPVHVTLHFEAPTEELRYVDQKRMGQLYLTARLASIPTFAEMGPDALEASPQTFRTRLRRFRGEIKGVLSREQFVAGIGNAYADEILWQARLHPYRKVSTLSPEEIDGLHAAMNVTLRESIEKVEAAMGEDIHLKPRDFFAVHMRGGQACPRCGGRISEITAQDRITNFCRSCQPGGLIRGL
ncbi:MAG TPA: DNA-formamidopyrimidine glycosylase family protein [Anaerolineales bacterium]